MRADKKEAFITSNDGVKLAYEVFGSDGPVVVLLHGAQVAVSSHLCATGKQSSQPVYNVAAGWSGSRHYYDRNVYVRPGRSEHVLRLSTLTRAYWVCLPFELRAHAHVLRPRTWASPAACMRSTCASTAAQAGRRG
jgi:hypothetical protein